VRSNPKSGTPKNGSVRPRIPRRRTARSETEESVALATVSEDSIREEIARLAYLFWEKRGGTGGSPEEDWLRAEQEILAR
jgi:hypothetical protein